MKAPIPANTILSDRVSIFGNSVCCADSDHTALVFGDTYGFQIAVPASTTTVLDIYLSTDGTENTFSIREDSSTGTTVETGTVSTYVDDDYTASEHFTYKLKNDTESDKSYYLRTDSGTLRLMCLSTAEYPANAIVYTSYDKAKETQTIIDMQTQLTLGCQNTFVVPPFSKVKVKAKFSEYTGNAIRTTSNKLYIIDDITEICNQYNSEYYSESTITFTSMGVLTTLNRADIKSTKMVVVANKDVDYWGAYLCGYMTNLVSADITFDSNDDWSEVGARFFNWMFYNCLSLTTLNEDFTIPQTITKCGDWLCERLFAYCSSLEHIPENFNLPQNITSNTNAIGMRYMFVGCSKLKALPENFNLPQGIDSTLSYANFCDDMFEDCSSLEKLPDNFKIPDGVTRCNSYFMQAMFHNCTSLKTLPDNFKIPQLTSWGSTGVFNSTFYNCSSLQAGNNVVLTFPCDASNTFYGTSFTPTSPSAGSTYYIKGNNE